MSRAWLFAVLLVSGSVSAGDRVRVAVHPIVAPGVDDARLVSDLNREVQNILAETERVTVVSSEDVEKRLSEEGGRCPTRGKERTDCLERVALATRAVYIVAVTVKRLGKDYELSAAIADADRVLLEQPEPLTVSDTGAVKIDVALKHQLRTLLLDRLKVASLPSDPRMRNPQVVQPNPNPEPVPPVPPLEPAKTESTIGTLRLASFIAGGVAVVGGITALIFAMVANSTAGGLSVSGGVLLDPAQLGKLKESRTNAGIAVAMGSVAGVAAVGAVLLFILGPAEEPKATVAPIALAGGAGVAFSGRFP